MNRPRLFISAVSTELKAVRQAVAHTTFGLGYEPIWQDVFHTAPGKLLQILRDKIDNCEGLLQIAGYAYGAEPPIDTEFGRVSYTQYEFLYAQQQGKKTWLIKAGELCQRDKPIEQLDLPSDELNYPDPAAYQAERRLLQQAYLDRLEKEENHLYHPANDDITLENIVLKLRDDLGSLQLNNKNQQQRQFAMLAAILLGVLVFAGGGWWIYHQIAPEIHKISTFSSEIFRANLQKTIEETYQNELNGADKASDWQQRQRLHQAADAAKQQRLSKVEELGALIAEITGTGNASSVFTEMARILSEPEPQGGVDQAIAYIASQRSNILQTVKARAANVHERNRADLQPLLQTAALYQNKGQARPARELYADVFKLEPDWPAALHQYFVFLINQGDDARVHATLADALREYNAAKSVAEQLVVVEPSGNDGQYDLGISNERLGDIFFNQGNLEKAYQAYLAKNEIISKLAASDANNTFWQRDLSVSYNKLGDVAVAQGHLGEAAQAYRDDLAIAKTLAASDPSNSGWQRDLSVSYEKLGDVSLEQGQLGEAAQAYRDGLAIRKALAASDPSNSGWQRDLSVSYNKLGDVAVTQGQLGEAAQAYRDSLAIRKTLAASDPSNSGWQRDLSYSFYQLSKLQAQQKQWTDALGNAEASLKIDQRLSQLDLSNVTWQKDVKASQAWLVQLRQQMAGDKP